MKLPSHQHHNAQYKRSSFKIFKLLQYRRSPVFKHQAEGITRHLKISDKIISKYFCAIMELDQEEVGHLLGESLLAALDQGLCGHEGHNPFSFGKNIKTGMNDP